eukprot:CAMPEP_0198297694 /NCGR_PEP_ID=MMETSP1449-20131203/37815_1 /TAXON_ID=420275 /ORGANISM="Attheya septentrionalis, Strain CCMP2084" /LENGTH=378 /DNA_ID=CAMNT_0043998717 /DNA_START=1085 /DNA_END=2221 /DNA_ORIENTATION=+
MDEVEPPNLVGEGEQSPNEYDSDMPESMNDFDAPNTLCTDLWAIIDDKELCDVQLKGIDNIMVPAIRVLLVARSPVLRFHLISDPSIQKIESDNESVVIMCYHSVVLQCLVEFCFTDRVTRVGEHDMSQSAIMADEGMARHMVNLVKAAHEFELRTLERKSIQMLQVVLANLPGLACAVLDEAEKVTPSFPSCSQCVKIARRIIREKSLLALIPHATSPGTGIEAIQSGRLVGQLMKDPYIQADELTLFRCLVKWSQARSETSKNDYAIQETGSDTLERSNASRTDIAKGLVHTTIDLTKIIPSVLCTYVLESGLVTQEDVSLAFRTQALLSETNGTQFSQWRQKPMEKTNIIDNRNEVVRVQRKVSFAPLPKRKHLV